MKRSLAFVISISLLFCFFPIRISASETYGKVYCRSTNCQGKIALTFDDGPHPRYTKEILAILEEYHVTATFFIIGVNAENYPLDLQRIVDAGCEIGNHTYSHPHVNRLNEEELRNEVARCEAVIEKLCHIRPTLFRPPEGMMNEKMKPILSNMEYNAVLWSIDTKDWAMNPSEKICKTVFSSIQSGDIILMHDYVSGGNTTCQALRKMIPKLLAEGYEFVTVSELIKEDHE